MAENHTRAVQEHCDIEDPLTRHILEIIALDIGRDEKPAYTSNRKIAARARTSVNTARDRIDCLVSEGYLTAVKDGKYMFYSLNEERIPYQRISGEDRAKTVGGSVLTHDDLQDIVLSISTDINTMVDTKFNTMAETLYQRIVSIVSTPSTGINTKDKEREEYIYMPPLTDEQQAIITKLTKICKTPYFDKAEDEYRDTALMLMGWDATPESIEQFAKWWARNGWHKGLPELITVAREYRNFLNGVVKKPDETKGSSWTPA